MILGKKNTGKSTLAEYLKNTHPSSVCILDCDIGRSLSISGCVSLLTEKDHINLWIGEFTPFNCI
jgi:polynucleotide 5'-kinase involved in rRNA processing